MKQKDTVNQNLIKEVEKQNKILKELAEKFRKENDKETPPSVCKTLERVIEAQIL